MFDKGEIFLGVTKSHLRTFCYATLRDLKPTHEKVILPCVGSFNLAKIAIEAGYKPENIYCSDISAYSNLLGFLFSGQKVEDIEGLYLSPEIEQEVRKATTEAEKVAIIFYYMKVIKIKKLGYRDDLLEYLIKDRQCVIEKYKKNLEDADAVLHGIHYEVADIRDVVKDYGEDAVIITFPPLFAGGYTKMFDFDGEIESRVEVEEFKPDEFAEMFNTHTELGTMLLTFLDKVVEGIDKKYVVMCKEYKVGKYDIIYSSHPEMVPEKLRGKILPYSRHHFKPLKMPLFTDKDEITEDSKVEMFKIKGENALYYRDLFVHNLGTTTSDNYYVLTIDKKIVSVCGINASDAMKFRTEYVFEMFGVSTPLEGKYRGISRLLEWCLTSQEFKRLLYSTLTSINRVYRLNGVKTVCLTKHDKVKSHHRIFEVLDRKYDKKLDLNRIEYYARFRKDNFQDCLKVFLEELKNKKEK